MASPLHFPPQLPVSARVADIAAAIDAHPVVIVAGATGSGKTTQIPKIALAMGRGLERIIGVTQPRRLAATSVAERVASEIGSPLGQDVGYQIRFDDRTSPQTYVKFMTDGILLAEIHGDPKLTRYDTLIIDEAHERSLTIDFLLGWLKRILPERPDLKVIVSSATIETERFSSFFGRAPVVHVEGRTYPVEVLYEPPADDDVDLSEAVASAVANVASLDPSGDVLVFLPGEREIRDAERELLARRLPRTVVQPLYARLSAAEQHRVFTTGPERRVILATNVAETSVTIPGIVYVVDSGVARLSRYEPRSGTTRLQIEGISQASADQRKGRCGRVREGVCIRLYDETSFAARPAFTDPEIKRTGLAGVILRMKSLGLGDVESFPFLDPPHSKSVTEGYRVLTELGALGENRELTKLGERLACLPVDPRIGRMILASAELGCLPDVLVIAAALSVQDPRERPRDAAQKADERHRLFRDETSDFLGFLKLWEFVREAERKGSSHLRRVCKESFLSFMRLREWREVHRQLEQSLQEITLAPAANETKTPSETKPEDRAERIHRALLCGLLSKVGKWNSESRIYLGPRQTRFALHPSSALARKPPAWMMAFELVETAQLFARVAAKIEPAWLLEAGAHLLKRTYDEPHWSERSARASVKEHVTLFGLTVERDRSVDYARVAPIEARRMFLDHALVRGDFKTRGSFQEKNRDILKQVAQLRDKARRSDMMADDDALLAFFETRVPAEVVDGKSFETWRARAEASDPGVLHLALGDVLTGDQALLPSDYPDSIALHGATLPLAYRFDPFAKDDDGVTMTVPLALLPQLSPGELDWTIPGWHREKIAALLYELPRALRRDLGDIDALSRALAADLVPFEGAMVPALAKAVEARTGAVIPLDAFRLDQVASYLRLVCRICDASGRVVAQSRDVAQLLRAHGAQARQVWQSAPIAAGWERKGLTAWDFGAMPAFLTRQVGGVDVRSYPGVVDKRTGVDLVLFESAPLALAASRAGVRRLVLIAARTAFSQVIPRFPRALPRGAATLHARAADEAFRELLLYRVAETAFELSADETQTPLPRDKASFEALVTRGTPRIAPVFREISEALAPVAVELDKTWGALQAAAKHPSGRVACADIEAHLEALVPVNLVAWVPLSRLTHLPRYVRAMQVRLARALSDPRKDSDKRLIIAPLWAAFSEKRKRATDTRMVDDVRWLFEELRVAVFAPELKTPVSVSAAKVAAAVAALR